ncbi:hypothetical protein SBOR_9067 [Sclerotinia borealis F-4128]|uniref:Tim44-like domain-containing protein n=1 Tax=Sclerotinia borealis (strain F-4128) TaxID=1432307 RepID=W9C6L6_SCLBF|nr:hypothetical protein SBOR_9067 [Sclerotinia borealis F-4128]
MAQTLRSYAFTTPRRTIFFSNSRHFSVINPRQAAPPNPAQHPDRRLRMQALTGKQMASDVGLLPKTFIAARAPSLFRSPKRHLKFQWARLKTRFWDNVAIIAFKWMSPRTGRISRKVQIKRGSITAVAEALYREMYQNFAAGNAKSLQKICLDGLYESFSQRIASRPKGQRVSWNLDKLNRRPKIMSTRAVMLPGGDGNVIRQAVVRISSRQSMILRDRNGKKLPASNTKDVVEYVVVQKIYRNWQDKEWQIWGTTRATTSEDVEQWGEMA